MNLDIFQTGADRMEAFIGKDAADKFTAGAQQCIKKFCPGDGSKPCTLSLQAAGEAAALGKGKFQCISGINEAVKEMSTTKRGKIFV